MKEIVIPHELIDLNNYVNAERANRFQGAKLKKKYTRLCALSVKSAINQGLAVTEIDMPIDLHFTWYVPSKRLVSAKIRTISPLQKNLSLMACCKLD